MSMDNPTFINDYRDGYSYVIHCERHGLGATPWTVAVEVFKDDELVMPRRRDHDHSFATYDDAREAGVRIARALIDQVLSRG